MRGDAAQIYELKKRVEIPPLKFFLMTSHVKIVLHHFYLHLANFERRPSYKTQGEQKNE